MREIHQTPVQDLQISNKVKWILDCSNILWLHKLVNHNLIVIGILIMHMLVEP